MAGIADDRPAQGSSPLITMIVVCSALVLVALPLFMVGGLAVQIKEALGLSESELGAAVTIGFIVGSLSSPIGGRLSDRIGARRSIYLGCALCAAALAGLGLVAQSWGVLVAFLCVAGVAIALTDPSLAILISRLIPTRRQGTAFGIKEASIPAATLIAGLAVPSIALTVGWRWAFLLGLVPIALILILLPRLDLDVRPRAPGAVSSAHTPTPHRAALLLTAVAAALGIAAASGVGIFLTDSAVAMGLSPGRAGLLLAFGSIAGIVARIACGVRADRTGGPQFRLIAGMLAVGGVAMALGGTGTNLLLVIGTLGTFAAGWAWTGIYFLSLVATYPDRPGAVAGAATAGLGMGNALGPILFGLVAETWSYQMAWIGAGVLSGIAAIMMLSARPLFRARPLDATSRVS